MVNLIFFLISLLATTVGAISGIGGGVIIKPVLDAFGLLGVSTISFLSGCTVLSMSVVSLLKSRGSGVKLEVRKSTFLGLGAAAGGVVGKYLFDLMKGWFPGDAVVGAVQSAVLIAMTVFVFFFVRYKSKISPKQVQNSAACLLIGLSLGMLSAFLGIGGGPINIAVLYYFFSMDAKTSARNSIYIILFSQITSLVRTFAAGAVPAFDPWLLALMIAGGVGGGFLGSAISRRLTNSGVDKLFSGVMLVIILVSCYNFVRFVI
ncbi:MAG: sulfite exporter TauE/SafE family protein [Clostridia bacterium]|nr:sulfite exporter TauE/SafE family protein [Clostridia bacterium]